MNVEITTDGIRASGTLLRLLRHLDQRLRVALGESLGIQELSVLGAVDRGAVLPSAIARALRLDPARVTRVVDQLVAAGNLERGADPADRRRCPLVLTPLGARRLEAGRAAIQDTMDAALADLPAELQSSFLEALERIREGLEEA